MTIGQYDEILIALAQAPNESIDHKVTPLILDLVGKDDPEVSAGLKAILDICAYYALASTFSMQAMDLLWQRTGAHESKTEVPL